MEKISINGVNIPVQKTGTIIVGTGVAGFNCADIFSGNVRQ